MNSTAGVGATAWDIRRLVFREGMGPVVLGLGIGVLLSFALNGVLRSQLVGVSPYDPITLATTPAVLIVLFEGFAVSRVPAG